MRSEGKKNEQENQRRKFAEIAQATQKICKEGLYETGEGELYEIEETIASAKKATRLYTETDEQNTEWKNTDNEKTLIIRLLKETTLSAFWNLQEDAEKIGILNFASARNPGGGYARGSNAQEESLARSSALVPCLLTQEDTFYQTNRETSQPFYHEKNILIYTPQVPFFKNDNGMLVPPKNADVVTSVAPNLKDIKTTPPQKDLHAYTTKRIKTILASAKEHGVKTLILGAWGCGVFENDPKKIAEAFKEVMETEKGIPQIIFAIPDEKHLTIFEQVFTD